MEHRSKSLAFFIIPFLFVVYGYFYQDGFLDQQVRLNQIRALVLEGRLDTPGLISSTDYVVFEGKLYSNKAPGSTFLGVVPFWLGYTFSKLFTLPQHVKWTMVLYITTLLAISLLSAVGAFFLFLVTRRITDSSTVALLLTLIYSLGTLMFPFSTLYFGHAISASLVTISFALVFMQIKGDEEFARDSRKLHFLFLLSGFLAGYSVATEYPSIIIVFLIGVYLLLSVKRTGWRCLFFWAAGAFLGVEILLAYNYRVFHNPFIIAYSLYGTEQNPINIEQAHGFLGITYPSLQVLYEITFVRTRGLFYFNPVLVLVPLAAVIGWCTRRALRKEIILMSLMFALYLLFNSSYGTSTILFWGGNVSTGPRHLIPVIPFLVILIACAARPLLWVLVPLGLWSFFIMLMATAVNPHLDILLHKPIGSYLWFNYLQGRFALQNFGMFSKELVTHNSIAWNLGKVLALKGVLQLIPLLAFIWWMVLRKFKTLAARQHSGAERKVSLRLAFYGWTLFMLLVALLPAAHLLCYSSYYAATHGYALTVYGNTEFEGTPLLQLKVRDINFEKDFIKNLIPPEVNQYSILVTGQMTIKEAAFYEFYLLSDDGSRFWIEDELIVDNWGDHGAEEKTGGKFLTEGKWKFQLKYYNRFLWGCLRLQYLKVTDAEEAEQPRGFGELYERRK